MVVSDDSSPSQLFSAGGWTLWVTSGLAGGSGLSPVPAGITQAGFLCSLFHRKAVLLCHPCGLHPGLQAPARLTPPSPCY